MKRIKYKYMYAEINHGTEEQPDIERAFVTKHIPYSEENLIHAKEEAYNGEVTVEEVADPELTTADKIAILKEQLSATDYKIIKCSEAQLVGEELPYDIVALHAERQAIRDQINELEESES